MSDIFNFPADTNLLLKSIQQQDRRVLSRCISLVENEADGYMDLLQSLPADHHAKNIIGLTGPPGAGKSTLIDALISYLINDDKKKIAVVCVDPSSPFHFGALLGDRIRMSKWFNHPHVFIRSLASRGNLGGLNPKVIEITDLLKAADFDYIIIETVGVGQSEVEIAAIADTTIVVLTPEAGDDIQTMKAGLMEIADIFVVNKSDHPEADSLVKNLILTATNNGKNTPVVKTIASQNTGIEELSGIVVNNLLPGTNDDRRYSLLAEKAYQLIQNNRMKNISKKDLAKKIEQLLWEKDFNFYKFILSY
jgi:LAO/AO transport system kinase